ncbi:sulfate adenylyltransferase subunit CysN [Aureimonas phyllosphaerae]|uniref:Sulfate adenylyltransferase subunit 1 n=1 Tax=Aureimonas phyllosphaerae TaxID=1166078 RepID=A0A7W6FUT6_9HYPH|nr:sulfate adenylyltransferase subunit CysN [Aureimonas phyllosphaerae]MBB3936090.1 sulfate adenylyltransferase large subunit [Aureimonas phyllosphaerae]MBB3960185.1 sulfate adenylyltransferase large subunit [Aureimonas phyllosphaerae]SFF34109.1 sulfate adenylyltransferase subunit 1 [Aureimonas phyllosphaerae]
MSGALKTQDTAAGDEILAASANERALVEDETFAGPAPDGAMADAASDEIVDPQADMPLLASPAESLLRFITCGSVDDGKSTLIGRLLYDTNSVFDDQLDTLKRDSKKFGTTGEDLDFALLVDGLSAEREQGITIDVAYRYFSTGKRAFIIADTPGHEQYTRNMATGASQAELAVILVDARKGILPQTRRHSFITSMVGIKSVIVAINKMDLVDFDEATFRDIVKGYEAIRPSLGFTSVTYIPLSAKNGDNLASRSSRAPWYDGPTLLEALERAEPETLQAGSPLFRLPVQWVNRPNLDFRGFCGTVAGGRVRKGDAVLSLPSRQRSHVRGIFGPNGEVEEAEDGEAITLTLTDEIDASRGDVIVREGDAIAPQTRLEAEILWMVDRPLIAGARVIAKLASAQTPATVRALREAVDIHSYQPRAANALLMNEIGRVTLAFDKPLVATTYGESRELGAFILIDQLTNETVALGIVTALTEAQTTLLGMPAPVTAAKGQPAPPRTAFDRAKAEWLGPSLASDARRARGVTLFRGAAAVMMAVIALLLGLAVWQALILGVLDFVLRPYLRRLMVPAETEALPVDPTDVRDGAGI